MQWKPHGLSTCDFHVAIGERDVMKCFMHVHFMQQKYYHSKLAFLLQKSITKCFVTDHNHHSCKVTSQPKY